MAEQVTLMLVVHDPDAMGGFSGAHSHIYEKNYTTPFLPNVGELVMLYDHEGEVNDGPSQYVKRRWWNTDGSILVELIDYQIDPNPTVAPLVDGKYRCRWESAIDGDLKSLLVAGGWISGRDR